jgi:uncharacterized damage-inducible protein DinB
MTLSSTFLKELEAEVRASRACLERVPPSLFGYKPHEKSMQMGYLASIVAEIPRWVTTIVQKGEINFGTWERFDPKMTEDLVDRFDQNMVEVRKALKDVPDAAFAEPFNLKQGEQVLMSSSKEESVSSSINHLVHHRGQLTVYMRLNDIPVPSIYGPSADDKTF